MSFCTESRKINPAIRIAYLVRNTTRFRSNNVTQSPSENDSVNSDRERERKCDRSPVSSSDSRAKSWRDRNILAPITRLDLPKGDTLADPEQVGLPKGREDLGRSGRSQYRTGPGRLLPRGAVFRGDGIPGARGSLSVPQDAYHCRGRAFHTDWRQDT